MVSCSMQQRTIPLLDCDVWWKMGFILKRKKKNGFYTKTSDGQFSGWTEEKPPKPNLHQKRSSSLFGGVLTFSSTTAFWILVKPLHLRSMLSKLMRCTKIYLQLTLINRKNQFFSTVMPDHTSHRTSASKIESVGLWSFASTAIFT